MEGVIFYWLFWTFWIFSTFFLSKNHSQRYFFSVSILLTIICSLTSFSVFGYQLSLSTALLLFISYFVIGQLERKRMLYTIISSFIMMLAYTSFHMFELFDPVWVIFDRRFLLALLMWCLSLFIQKGFLIRIVTVISGMLHGEMMYAFILKRYSFDYLIGSPECFDVISLSIAFIIIWSSFERVTALLEHHFNHQEEREKEKLS